MVPEIIRHTEKFYYFYEVACDEGLQSASRRIGISAPSLSYSIRQLESIIGTALFYRSKSGVKLTEAGEKLFVFCKKYFREIEDIQRSMTIPSEQILLKIRIGTFQSIALYFWPLLIDSLDKNSKFSLSISTDRSKVILESLIRKKIDLALTVETLKHEKIIKHELYRDEYAFYCSSNMKKSKFTRSDIKNLPILLIPDAIDENGKTLKQYLHSWNLVFKDEFELDSFEVIAKFTIKQYGIGILPTKVAKTYGKELKKINLEGTKVSSFGIHRFYLSYRNDLEIPQNIMKLFLNTAVRAVMQLNSRASDVP